MSKNKFYHPTRDLTYQVVARWKIQAITHKDLVENTLEHTNLGTQIKRNGLKILIKIKLNNTLTIYLSMINY